MGRSDQIKSFSELYNLNESDLSNLVIKETNNKDNCYIYNIDNSIIGGFILIDKPSVKTIVNVAFHKSSTENNKRKRKT